MAPSTTPTANTGPQDRFLASSADALFREFSGTFGRETIDRFLHSSYARLAESATVTINLPVLTEKFARQRLRALALVDGQGHAGVPTVLFLCVHNAGRSQMALGFFQHYAGEAAIGWSGGSEPGDQVSRVAVEVMAERGIDISGEYPKPWTDEVVQAADVVISMGCGDACPIFPGKRYQEWVLPDPAAWTIDEVRPVRDEIERRVLALLAELEVQVSTVS